MQLYQSSWKLKHAWLSTQIFRQIPVRSSICGRELARSSRREHCSWQLDAHETPTGLVGRELENLGFRENTPESAVSGLPTPPRCSLSFCLKLAPISFLSSHSSPILIGGHAVSSALSLAVAVGVVKNATSASTSSSSGITSVVSGGKHASSIIPNQQPVSCRRLLACCIRDIAWHSAGNARKRSECTSVAANARSRWVGDDEAVDARSEKHNRVPQQLLVLPLKLITEVPVAVPFPSCALGELVDQLKMDTELQISINYTVFYRQNSKKLKYFLFYKCHFERQH